MKTNVAIIGEGIIGLSIGYNIARRGERDLVVIEGKHMGYGSSTRSASHFRVHFWSDENVRFAIEARKRLLRLGEELSFNPLVETNGYMWLLYEEALLQAYRKRNAKWAELGVPGRLLSSDDLEANHPYISTAGLLGAFFGPQDGSLHHDFLMFGYRDAILKSGGEIRERVEAKRLIADGNRIRGVETSTGFVEADNVVVAAGVGCNQILETLGIRLPMASERREICVLEPMRPFIKTFVINTKLKSFYVAQTLRGESIGSIDPHPAKQSLELGNTIEFLKEFSRAAVLTIPTLRKARVLRVWSGFYEVTPDHSQILGRDPEWPDGLYVAAGFSGHGLMMAPFVGEVMADQILEDRIHPLMKPYDPTRFEEKREIKETLVM